MSVRVYDRVGRVETTRVRKATAPDSWAETTYAYTPDGLMKSLTDAEGRTTDWTFDGLGRVRTMQYPQDEGVRQTIEIAAYDGHGKPLTLHHKASAATGAATLTWSMTYDPYGRMTHRTATTANLPPGLTFHGTDQQEFEFDDLGRMVRATDKTSGMSDIVVAMRYDTAGRLLEDDQRHPVNGTLVSHKVASAYDVTGFRTGLAYPDLPGGGTGYALAMTRDALGRLSSIEGPSDPASVGSTTQILASYTWMGPRPWERTHANFTETRYWDTHDGTVKPLYDPLGRLLGVRTTDEGTGANLGDFAGFRYGWDRVGNLMFEQRLHEPLSTANTYRTRAHRTDLLGRLERWREGATLKESDPTVPAILVTTIDPSSAVTSAADGETWALDLVGNWDKKATGTGAIDVAPTDDYAPPNPLHQYTSVTPAGGTSKPFEHDFLGQLRKNGRRNHEYTWDFFGRLTKVCEGPEGSCGAVATYRYDALNRRVEKVVEAPHPTWDRVTRFYYDGWRAIEERAVELEGTPQQEVEYVRARYGFGVGLDEVVWMDRDRTSGPDGTLESRYFFAHDLLGSVVAATAKRDSAGQTLQVAERYTYSAHGEVSVWTEGWSQVSETYVGPAEGHSEIGMPYLFTGQRQDPETGLWYFKNRVYDGENGRFLRRDLIGYADGPLLYRYAGGRPNAAVDPLGLSTRYEREWAQMEGQMSAEAEWGRKTSRWNGDVLSRFSRSSASSMARAARGFGPTGPGIREFEMNSIEWREAARRDPLIRMAYQLQRSHPIRGPLVAGGEGSPNAPPKEPPGEPNATVVVWGTKEKSKKGGGGYHPGMSEFPLDGLSDIAIVSDPLGSEACTVGCVNRIKLFVGFANVVRGSWNFYNGTRNLIAGGLAGATAPVSGKAGLLAGSAATAVGTYQIASGFGFSNRGWGQLGEARNETIQDESSKNLLGLLPSGQHYDDADEPSIGGYWKGVWDRIADSPVSGVVEAVVEYFTMPAERPQAE